MDWNDLNPLTHLSWATKAITTQSVLSPILWLAGIGVTACVPLALLGSGPLIWVICVILLTPVIFCLWAFVHVYRTDPDRLQTEKHQLAVRQIKTIGDDVTGAKPLVVEHTVTNPGPKEIK